MKVAVIGATGKAGNLIVEELKERGHEVTAIIRNAKKLNITGVHVLEKDAFELDATDIKPFEAVVNALGFPPDQSDKHVTFGRHLIDLFSEVKSTRLLVVGGAGSLYVDKEHTTQLIDTPEFPDAYKPIAAGQGTNLADLREVSAFDWTFVSPAADFRADGSRTGTYTKGAEEFFFNKAGNSYISYADYAVAMADEVENASVLKGRFAVVGEES
ncbi:NAD(P)-dependent oxidoreductase [Alkalicoccobacillus plakortidis]|uniref:NAD(P)-dependent oxidoreductase n=1 Tax=Alkalicoccobacillus plakortidis TaxID=444060 RepID=A0ABT0XQ98_9BACI|nr:NAD(P)-dependent oxidoreductase [Alkalicoccobacillus plakortidis]MCM2677533.1 NAD(P)-dependent oxidoreductase [Alkalicoccobacillus plakortidis]